MTKKDLAKRLRVAPVTVYMWKSLPPYAEAYLALMDEFDEYRTNIKMIVEKLYEY